MTDSSWKSSRRRSGSSSSSRSGGSADRYGDGIAFVGLDGDEAVRGDLEGIAPPLMQVREVVVTLEHGVNEPCEARWQVGFEPPCQGGDAVEDLLGAPPLLNEQIHVLTCPLDIDIDLDLVVGVKENEDLAI